MAQTVKNLPAIQETQIQSLGWEDLLENSMDRGAWRAAVHGVAKSNTGIILKCLTSKVYLGIFKMFGELRRKSIYVKKISC